MLIFVPSEDRFYQPIECACGRHFSAPATLDGKRYTWRGECPGFGPIPAGNGLPEIPARPCGVVHEGSRPVTHASATNKLPALCGDSEGPIVDLRWYKPEASDCRECRRLGGALS